MPRKMFVRVLAGVLVVVATMLSPSPANAQGRRGRDFVMGSYGYSPFFYDPFWGPDLRYGAYPRGLRASGDVRVLATPKQAEVFVDGFYAGVVDDFDGIFQGLHTTPGGHAITLHLEGYRTVTQNIYVTPDSTFKLHLTMDKLTPGEASEPAPIPARSLDGQGSSRVSPTVPGT